MVQGTYFPHIHNPLHYSMYQHNSSWYVGSTCKSIWGSPNRSIDFFADLGYTHSEPGTKYSQSQLSQIHSSQYQGVLLKGEQKTKRFRTNFTKTQLQRLKKNSPKIAILWAPRGVNWRQNWARIMRKSECGFRTGERSWCGSEKRKFCSRKGIKWFVVNNLAILKIFTIFPNFSICLWLLKFYMPDVPNFPITRISPSFAFYVKKWIYTKMIFVFYHGICVGTTSILGFFQFFLYWLIDHWRG